MSYGEDILPRGWGYTPPMTKRLIEVDDEKLNAVRKLLGTRTLKATVDGALDEVLALDVRRRALLAERGVGEEALADPEQRREAWG
jgi:Arc/MetJ family transcription regulator